MTSPLLAAVFAAALWATAALPGSAAAADPAPQFTALVAAPLVSPVPVAGSDGRRHLAYELSLVNATSLVVRLDAVAVVDAATGEELAAWTGDALAAVTRLNGHLPGVTFGPAESGLVFIDVPLREGRAAPAGLVHRLSTTRMLRAAGADPRKGDPLPASAGIPATATFTGARTSVSPREPVRLSPPLRGNGWVVVNGCCATVTSHRGAAMAFDGVLHIPERFAIDFLQLGADGTVFRGPADKVASYPSFGATVHAAAAGVVVAAVDGQAEQVPGAARSGVTVDNAAGNHVVVDLGGGSFALYAHLQPGSLRVKAGDRVSTGDVLGLLGNTGNSDAPHLHFHVMDGPSPLASEGLPYVFDRFSLRGRASLDDAAVEQGKPASIDPAGAGLRTNALPLDTSVVDFGP